jgi:hypothetical protein
METSAPVTESLARERQFVGESLLPSMADAVSALAESLGRDRVQRVNIKEGCAPQEPYLRVLLELMDAFARSQDLPIKQVDRWGRRLVARLTSALAKDRLRLGVRRNLGLRLFRYLADLIAPSEFESAPPGEQRTAALKRELERAAASTWSSPGDTPFGEALKPPDRTGTSPLIPPTTAANELAVSSEKRPRGLSRHEARAIATAAAREAAERVALSVARVGWKTMTESERITRAEGVTLPSENRTERGLARVLAEELATTEDAVRSWLRKLDRAKRRAIKAKLGIA